MLYHTQSARSDEFAIFKDFAVTAYIPSGEGPLSEKATNGTFPLFFHLTGKNGQSSLFNYVGLTIIFLMIISWIGLIWAGFVCIYATFPESILQGQNQSSTDLFEKIYHVGYTLSIG